MNERLSMDDRIGGLIAAYADQAPMQVEPLVVARLARTGAHRGPLIGMRLGPTSSRLVLASAVVGLLAAIAAGALVAGRQPMAGDPAKVIAQYAKEYVGWALVYEDGRVLLDPDLNAIASDP